MNTARRQGPNPPDGVMQLRVVVEVDSGDDAHVVDTTTTRMIDAGAEQVAQPTETPWRSRNSRLDAPGPVHLTLFQELDNGAQT
jgi:hypothetical protein